MNAPNKYYSLERKRRRRSSANEAPVSEVLNLFLKKHHIDCNLAEDKITEIFHEITGPVIRKFITEIYMQNTTLYIKTSLPSVKAELFMVREALKNNINNKLGNNAVTNIIIK